LEVIKPRKRRRVKKDPNSVFTGIEQIRRVQETAGVVEIEDKDTFKDRESSDTDSCIEVAVGSS
jgi:hypothetical protein